MYVLVKTDVGVMDAGAKVRVYGTREKAYEVMQREFTEWYVDANDLESEDGIGGCDDPGEFDLLPWEAFDGSDMDSATWNIFEIEE